MTEPERNSDLWKAMLYELHVDSKHVSTGNYACHYDECRGRQLSGIARLNRHMQKVHGWQILYPKLNVGEHLPSEIETWSTICNKWRSG
ncbi:hypothetical protein GOP47_0014465, partial [Adiantum capillus-veneris]